MDTPRLDELVARYKARALAAANGDSLKQEEHRVTLRLSLKTIERLDVLAPGTHDIIPGRYSTIQVAGMTGVSRKLIWDWVHAGLVRPSSLDELGPEPGDARRKAWWTLREAWEVRLVAYLRRQRVATASVKRAMDAVRQAGDTIFEQPQHLLILWDEEGNQSEHICFTSLVTILGTRYRMVAAPLTEPGETFGRELLEMGED